MHKISLHTKDFISSAHVNAKTVGVVAGSMIMSQKFLDLGELAKKFNVDVDNNKLFSTVITHQGAVKFVLALIALHLTKKKKIGKNEIFQWAMIGIMIQGGLQEINHLSNGGSGQIGDTDLDEQMKEAARKIKEGMSGNPTEEVNTGVAGHYELEDGTGVAGNPTEEINTGVAGQDEYSFLHGDDYLDM